MTGQVQREKVQHSFSCKKGPGKLLFACRWVGERSDAASPITRVEARRKSCLVTCVFFSTKEVLFSRKINEEGSEPFPFTKKEDLRTGTAINRMIVTVVLVWC